ncbi:MAG: DUF937 domain-containing protein [Mesorhizobium sp.]|nr:MAG: DUF937 domain-containing protein [Mesorhizobium sp.]
MLASRQTFHVRRNLCDHRLFPCNCWEAINGKPGKTGCRHIGHSRLPKSRQDRRAAPWRGKSRSKQSAGRDLGSAVQRRIGDGAWGYCRPLQKCGSRFQGGSWVSSGPNQPIEPKEVEAAIDDETLASLSMQTGLSRDELIARITRDLPEAVNKLTPNGELPPAGPDDVTLLDPVPPQR